MDGKQLLKSWVLIAVGVLIAANTSRGIHFDDNASLIVAVLLLSILNVFLKPLLLLFSLPFVVLTFGLGIWLINSLLFLLVGALVEGFFVASFWHALWGAFVVSATSVVANVLFPSGQRRNVRVDVQRGTRPPTPPPSVGRRIDEDDVIDI